MPNILQFEAGPLQIHPTQIGTEAEAAAARRGGAFFNQRAEALSQIGARVGSTIRDAGQAADDYMFHQEVSHGAPVFAELTADKTAEWNKLAQTSDPNDASIQKGFLEKSLEPALEKFKGAFNTERGQQWAEAHIDALRSHMFEKTTADMSTNAGIAVQANLERANNARTNTARSDPTATQTLLDQVDRDTDGILAANPSIRGPEAFRIRTEVSQKQKGAIVKAGAIGTAEKSANPEEAVRTFSERFNDYISGPEIDELGKKARYYRNINKQQERADEAEARRQLAADQSHDAAAILQSTEADQIGGPPKAPKDYGQRVKEFMSKYPQMVDASLVQVLIHRGEEVGRQLDADTAANLKRRSDINERTLYDQIHLPADDPRKITDESEINRRYSIDGLTWEARDRLRREVIGTRTPEGRDIGERKKEFLDSIKRQITKSNPLMGKIDESGDRQFDHFRTDLDEKIEEYQRTGKNPKDLFNYKKPDYMGSDEVLRSYQKSTEQSLADRVRSAVSGAPSPPIERARQPEPPKAGTKPALPEALKDREDHMGWSPSKGLWYDQVTREAYDKAGNKVK